MMEGVESRPFPEAAETRMGATSGLAIQHFAACGGPAFFVIREAPLAARPNHSAFTI
jgi:hypothetical protein